MAHHNTVFAQLLRFVPRHEFEAVAREHRHGQELRAMSRWSQFVALGPAQLQSRGVTFVTRLKRGVRYLVTCEHDVRDGTGVVSDEAIELTSARGRQGVRRRSAAVGEEGGDSAGTAEDHDESGDRARAASG